MIVRFKKVYKKIANLNDALKSIDTNGFQLFANKTTGSFSTIDLHVGADGDMGVRYYYLNTQNSINIHVGYNILKIDIFLICNDASDSDSKYTLKCGGTVTTNTLNSGNKATCRWAFVKPILGVTLGALADQNDGAVGRTYKNTGKDDNSMQITQFRPSGRIREFTVEYSGEGAGSANSILLARVFYEQ